MEKTNTVKLAPRETEVLCLISQGVPIKAIPWQLSISLSTVKRYTKSARRKLGAHSTAHAVRLAIEHGFIELNLN